MQPVTVVLYKKSKNLDNRVLEVLNFDVFDFEGLSKAIYGAVDDYNDTHTVAVSPDDIFYSISGFSQEFRFFAK